jgi:hypothetical protein
VYAVADNSMLYVTDTGNSLLRAVSLLGSGLPAVYTVSPNRTQLGDVTNLRNPFDLTVSRDGRVIFITVSDRMMRHVRNTF